MAVRQWSRLERPACMGQSSFLQDKHPAGWPASQAPVRGACWLPRHISIAPAWLGSYHQRRTPLAAHSYSNNQGPSIGIWPGLTLHHDCWKAPAIARALLAAACKRCASCLVLADSVP